MLDAFRMHNRFAERVQPDRMCVLLVDCQARLVERYDPERLALSDNLLGLARLARAFSMPVVLATLRDGRYGELLPALAEETPAACRVERAAGDFWHDAASVDAVKAQGRRDLLVAGIDPEGGLAGLALGGREAGFLVRAVADASAGGTPSSQRIGAARMSAAGIEVTSWVAIMAEFSSATRSKPQAAASAAPNDSLARYQAGAAAWSEERPIVSA